MARTSNPVTRPCSNCGQTVSRKKSEMQGERVYCSHKCFTSSKEHGERIRERTLAAYPDAVVTVHCVGCGKTLQRHRSRAEGKARIFCTQECRRRHQADVPIRQLTNQGYIKVYVGKDYPGATKTGHLLEHRKVMSELLGRPLLDEENVHHVNGDRADNSATNLELWTRSQPAGQRVEDKVRWARQILALYGDLIPD